MPFLSLKNINKKFKASSGDFYALKDIDIAFSTTGFTAIVGKSGSGKSTLLNIILGIEKPTTGEVLFQNKNILKLKKKRFAKFRQNNISIIFQHYNLFNDLTIEDNVILPLLIKGINKKEAIRKSDELLKRFSLLNLKDRKCFNLSGGEKQRVAIARALITNPDIILCDEPTGALDEANSQVVMSILKEVAQERLVIIVSHNQKLVDEYCDRIVTLKNGTIISDIKKLDLPNVKTNKVKEKIANTNWKKIFINKHFKTNLIKNILTIFATSFGLLSTMISIGFSDEIAETSRKAASNNLYVSTATVSKKEYIEIQNSPLQYEKSTRPENEELTFMFNYIPSLDIEPNLSYFVPSFPNIIADDEILTNISYLPIFDDERIVSYQDVIVNDIFLKQHKTSFNNLTWQYSISPSIQTGDLNKPIIKDNFNLQFKLNVVGVVEEFSFLNTPKIYFSYRHMLDYISALKLTELSQYYNRSLTCLDYVLESANDSMPSSFSSLIFIKNKKDINNLFSLKEKLDKEESSIRIDSTVYSIVDTYVNFMTSFSSSLNVFIVISFLGVNFILAITSLSSFITHKKESAILTVFGAKNKDIISIFLSESLLVVILSLFLSFSFVFPLQNLINKIVQNRTGILNIINVPFLSFKGVPFLLPVGVCLVAIFTTLVFVLTPLLIYKNISLTNELKDE